MVELEKKRGKRRPDQTDEINQLPSNLERTNELFRTNGSLSPQEKKIKRETHTPTHTHTHTHEIEARWKFSKILKKFFSCCSLLVCTRFVCTLDFFCTQQRVWLFFGGVRVRVRPHEVKESERESAPGRHGRRRLGRISRFVGFRFFDTRTARIRSFFACWKRRETRGRRGASMRRRESVRLDSCASTRTIDGGVSRMYRGCVVVGSGHAASTTASGCIFHIVRHSLSPSVVFLGYGSIFSSISVPTRS